MERGIQENPALNRLSIDRDAFRSHILNDYTEDWNISTDPRRSNSIAYPSLVVRPSYRYSEREFHHHMHNEPSNPINAIDNASRIESLRAYRNDFTFLNTAERYVSSRPVLRSPNEQINSNSDNRLSENDPMILHMPNRRYQQPNYVPSTGLTRSFTERRPRLARTDKNFRRSFTGRVEDYRAEYARRTNFSMETSL